MKRLQIGIVCALFLATAACGKIYTEGGELTGVNSQVVREPAPRGMVLIKRGSMQIGNAEDDPLWGNLATARNVSMENFWMDETEITNAQYRQFVYWVRDSVLRKRLADPAYGANELFQITEDKDGNPYATPIINWKRPIPTERRATEDELKALQSIYAINPITGEMALDANQMIYRYETFDTKKAAVLRSHWDVAWRNSNTDNVSDEPVMISKDTAYINEEGMIVRETITRQASSFYDFVNTYILNIYPNEACWVKDFYDSYNDPYMRQYFTTPGYDDYPVIGVSWDQAQAFCAWRTEQLKRSLSGAVRNNAFEPFRLPTEAEFEYAARSGKTANTTAWQQKKAKKGKDGKDCALGNFKPGEGDYTDDGFLITAKVASFPPNEFGLYDMAGNVAEWTSTSYVESGVHDVNDMNPEYTYTSVRDDPDEMKRKVVRGGSWKDVSHFIRPDVRAFDVQTKQRSYIGFRCVRSQNTPASKK
ncbi:gliding motility-associated protein GldK [Candidatus Symbiothrix dinenymphae]|nr:gliding motility-associated protein GldK [Candidatus Symbiothrix dinenymphae]